MNDLRSFILGLVLSLFAMAAHAEDSSTRTKLFVEPSFSIEQINDVIRKAPDDSTIVFKSGQYIIKTTIQVQTKRKLHLQAESGVVLDAQIEPTTPKLMVEVCVGDANRCEVHEWRGEPQWIPQYVNFNGFATIEILDSQDVEIEGFAFRNSFPNSISIMGLSQSIRIHHCDFVGGTNAIFAAGLQVLDLELSFNSWNQDPTGRIWSSLDWQHVHHGLYNYFNGAFFQARDVGGQVRIRGNSIKNAFNGIRMKVTQVGVGSEDVSISNNQFYKIADNVIEPEIYAKDWGVVQNWMGHVYAPFSLDSVQGENLVISQNIVDFSELPRRLVPDDQVSDSRHQGGRLLKFESEENLPIAIQVFDNIVRTRCQEDKYTGPLTDIENLPEGLVIKGNHFQRDIKLNELGDQIPKNLKMENWFYLP